MVLTEYTVLYPLKHVYKEFTLKIMLVLLFQVFNHIDTKLIDHKILKTNYILIKIICLWHFDLLLFYSTGTEGFDIPLT